ncbi:MAG: filamentous hemagglutinin N-terminal domain-containing protein [Methylococcales bacterium]|nr:filamentous hemagglutinin N-terminal domain-containing protein [Methylococcales bacterium]
MPAKPRQQPNATIASNLSWLLACLILLPPYAHADKGGIQTDGSVGGTGYLYQPQALMPNGSGHITIPENMGSRAGTNLFHSFAHFNINTGQTVTFTENSTNSLNNVIARVTGGDNSNLNGTLESTPGGHANFYLINPAGVLFGEDAHINVAGDFHVSTANHLHFADGVSFSASLAETSHLSADAPTAFGFAESTVANNSLLKLDGANLGIQPGKTLDLVGNKIEIINNAKLNVSQLPETKPGSQDAIEIRLVAQQGNTDVSLKHDANGYLPLPVQKPGARTAGDITLTNSTLDVSGNGGGRIAMWGKNIAINGIGDAKSFLQAENQGDVSATAAGGVEIWGNSVSLANSDVRISTLGKGSTGDLKVTAEQDLIVNNNSFLELSDGNNTVPVPGQKTRITLKTGHNLLLDGSSVKQTSNSRLGSGDLLVEAGRDIQLQNMAGISIEAANTQTGVLSIIAGNNLNITAMSHIDSSSSGSGNVTAVTLSAKGDISLKTGGSIFTETFGTGSAGPVEINAGGDVVIDGQVIGNYEAAYIFTGTGSLGAAKSIGVQASGNFILRNGGTIASNSDGQGQGGNINIHAQNILLEGNIDNSSTQYGNGGAITLRADDLVLLRHAKISTRATGRNGSGGDITITGNTLLLQSSSITADTAAKAHGGNIKLDLKNIIADYLAIGENASGEQNTDILGFSRISAAAPRGVSGLISFTTPQLNLSGVLMGFGSSQFLAKGLDSNACVRNDGSSLSLGGLSVMGVGLVDNE